MKNLKMYEPDDKMITLIKDNSSVLQALGSFGINLGFGDKTVSETCQLNDVDTYTFLAVVNFTINDFTNYEDDERISVPTLLHYLKASHAYYLDFQLPFIRRELQESISDDDPLGGLIMKFYDEYAQEIRRHMKYEEKTLFPYVESLIDGRPMNDYNIETFSKHHEQTDKKLRELKLMIIKYLPSDAHHNNQLTATLYDIYNNEEWLRQHADVEDHIFTPAIRRLEQRTRKDDVSKNISSMVTASATSSSASCRVCRTRRLPTDCTSRSTPSSPIVATLPASCRFTLQRALPSTPSSTASSTSPALNSKLFCIIIWLLVNNFVLLRRQSQND